MTQLLGGSADTVWFSQTINILGAALDAPITQAADYWGRKWFLVVLSALGFVGAMMVARAQNVALLIAGFTVMYVSLGTWLTGLDIFLFFFPFRPQLYFPLAHRGNKPSEADN